MAIIQPTEYRKKEKDMFSQLFERLMKIHSEWVNSYSYSSPEWDMGRQHNYQYGTIIGAIKDYDIETLQAIEEINQFPEEKKRKILVCYFKEEIRHSEKVFHRDVKNYIAEEKFKSNQKQLDKLLNPEYSLNDWYQNNYFVMTKLLMPEKDDAFYISQYILDILFQEYSRITCSVYNQRQENIISIYGTILNNEEQYSKYSLFTLDAQRDFLAIGPPRIYDKIIDKTIILHNVPKELAETLDTLHRNKLIGQLSFRLSNWDIRNGRNEMVGIMEEIEFGKVFHLAELGNPIVSKLYSKNYNNCLFVNVDSLNITFEEMCDDFTIYNNQIVTQVVHLEYRQSGTQWIITHIDHEYIFYTEDEYIKRTVDYTVKGTASPRMKSFKADRCEIPFTYQCSINWRVIEDETLSMLSKQISILQFILESYFSHVDLLEEYFANIK